MTNNIPSITRDSHNNRLTDRHQMDLPTNPFYRREPRPNLQHCRQIKPGEHTVNPTYQSPLDIRGRSEGYDIPTPCFRVTNNPGGVTNPPCENILRWNEHTKRRQMGRSNGS